MNRASKTRTMLQVLLTFCWALIPSWGIERKDEHFQLKRTVTDSQVSYQIMVNSDGQGERLLFTRMTHTLKEDEEHGGLRKYYRIRAGCMSGNDLGLVFETAMGLRYEIFQKTAESVWNFRQGHYLTGGSLGYLPPGVHYRVENLTMERPFHLVVHRRAYRSDIQGAKPTKRHFQEIFRFNPATMTFVRSIRR